MIKNFAQRAITSAAIVIVFSGAVILGLYTFLALIVCINILALAEFYRLHSSPTLSPRAFAGIILSSFLFISGAVIILKVHDLRILLFNIPVAFSIFIYELYKKADKPFYNLAFTFLGIIVITFPLILFSSIAFLPLTQDMYHPYIILGYLFIIWTNDTAAYFIGKNFGRHALFYRISPHKTWEGSIGGILCTTLTTYLDSRLFTEINLPGWLVIALLVIVTGTYGDLVKSMMKRSLGVKDSGTILPGHGGILDRFDSLLASAPFVFSYLMLRG